LCSIVIIIVVNSLPTSKSTQTRMEGNPVGLGSQNKMIEAHHGGRPFPSTIFPLQVCF